MRCFRLSWFLALLPLLGCQQETPKVPVVPVSGRVTLDGQPLKHAMVSFQSTDAKAKLDAWGETDDNGNYSLRPADNRAPEVTGAAVGDYRVLISRYDRETFDSKGRPRGEVVPARYNTETKLACKVPEGGKSDANFDLKSR